MSQNREVRGVATTVTGNAAGLAVTYHKTVVVHVDGNGKITLNSDGWRTATTKLRMNQASNQFGLGFQVFQKGFAWYVQMANGAILPYLDGMTFNRA